MRGLGVVFAEPEKAQIGIEDADHLYREIRVPNVEGLRSRHASSKKIL